jgi:hypothetical protein
VSSKHSCGADRRDIAEAYRSKLEADIRHEILHGREGRTHVLTFADADLSYIAPAGGVQSYDLWRLDQITEVAAEFVRQKVDVIVTMGGAVAAFKQDT